MKTRKAVFLDSNLFSNAAYALELCKGLVPLKIKWYGSATVNALSNTVLLRQAAASGCRGLLIGFESLNRASLSGSSKEFNRPGDYLDVVRTCHDLGISVLGCFIFGFDGDDKHVFEKTVEFVDKACIDLVQYSILTPFPGTVLFKNLAQDKRILTIDWSLYDGKNVVFKPALMTEDELREGLCSAWKKTYSVNSIVKRILGSGSDIPLNLMGNLGFRYFCKKFFPNDSSRDTSRRFNF